MDILSLAFIYARYSLNMSSITGFGMKDCLSLHSLGWKHFISSRTPSDEPIYSYADKYMRHFVRHSIKGRNVGAFNQSYESQISDRVFKPISEVLGIICNKNEIIEGYTKYIKKLISNMKRNNYLQLQTTKMLIKTIKTNTIWKG